MKGLFQQPAKAGTGILEEGLKELKAKLQHGAAQAERGGLGDSEEVFEEMRQLIAERKRVRKKAIRQGTGGFCLRQQHKPSVHMSVNAARISACATGVAS